MILTLTDNQMLGLWRSGAGLEPAVSGASVERFDAYEVNEALRRQMRQWYLEILATASLDLVRITDITQRVKVEAAASPTAWHVVIPADTVRVVAVGCNGSDRIPLYAEGSVEAAALSNRFRRLCGVPVGLLGAGPTLTIYSRERPEITRFSAVCAPEDETYILDERALALIPNPSLY